MKKQLTQVGASDQRISFALGSSNNPVESRSFGRRWLGQDDTSAWLGRDQCSLPTVRRTFMMNWPSSAIAKCGRLFDTGTRRLFQRTRKMKMIGHRNLNDIVRLLVIITILLSPLASQAFADELAKSGPNVLFISVDDLNDWIGCLKGHPQALTPNMDRLAARGVLFSNAHCASPACNPSRAAVFTGLMPRVTKVWSNRSGSIGKLYPKAMHLPEAFSKAGYRTLGTGKLLHSKGLKGLDEYFKTEQRWSPLNKNSVKYTKKELASKGTNTPTHVTQDSQGKTVVLPLNRMPSDRKPGENGGESFDWGPFDVPDSDFGDTKITDWAIKKLQAGSDKPLFLGVGYYRPHIPLWAPKRFFERFKDSPGHLPQIQTNDLADVGPLGKTWAIEAVTAGSHATVVEYKQWQAAVEGYLACVTYVDHEIGRLLDSLDNSELGDNTVIVLWGDHGWHLGEKEHWGKWTGWERSTRVPLIVVPSKKMTERFASAGSKCEQPVGLIDLYPTLVELCGIEGPKRLNGRSLVPLLKDPNINTERAVVTSFDSGNNSLRTDRWRFIRYADGSEELYDLKHDPNEWKNLAGSDEHAKTKNEMSEKLALKFFDPTQNEWYPKYSKQENVPKPDMMLFNEDEEPELTDGFKPLFNGKDLSGWTPRGGTNKFEAIDNCIVGTCVPGSESTYLCTDANEYSDFIFSCDLKWEVDGNSGVQFRSDFRTEKGKKNKDIEREVVFGPQLEMEGFSKDRGWSGGIYGQSCGGYFYPLWLKGHNAARKALKQDWNRITVSAQGNVVKTWLNGVPCSHWVDDGTYVKGFFALQVHKGKEGTVLFKNLRIKEINGTNK
jgi:arylsulfatase A-like enzyme